MKCKKRPILVGEPYSPWHHKFHKDKYFDKISYEPYRKLVKIDQRINLTSAMKRSKMKYIRKGFATLIFFRQLFHYTYIVSVHIEIFLPYVMIIELRHVLQNMKVDYHFFYDL